MKIIIVDSEDNQIGLKEFGTLDYEDIYQVSALWLTDIKTGDVLIAQRKWTKHNDPGKWSAAAAGTVDEGETYEENIIKEIEEEIGLTGLDLTEGPKEFIDDGKHKYFVKWFFASVDKDTTKITVQEEEVEDTKWIPQKVLVVDVSNNPEKYTPHFDDSLKAVGRDADNRNN